MELLSDVNSALHNRGLEGTYIVLDNLKLQSVIVNIILA
jgi:hypothetical protein